MPPYSAHLESLVESSRKARETIATAFIDGKILVPGTDFVYAWGQYLAVIRQSNAADLGSQYGIFGSTAAMQVIARQDRENELLPHSSCILPLVRPRPEGESEDEVLNRAHKRFADKGDLEVVYKLCALLDAAVILDGPDAESTKRVVGAVLRGQTSGWADYRDGTEYRRPNTHATAVALLSLSAAVSDEATLRKCARALEWFADQELDYQSIATLSMIVMAVSTLGQKDSTGSIFRTDKIRSLTTKCESALLEWIRTTPPEEVRRSLEGTEYRLPVKAARPSANRFTFLFYLPHCLAALAVLGSGRLLADASGRRFVLGVVGTVAVRVRQDRYFAAAGRNLASTVEHLWLYRLLYTFEQTEVYSRRRHVLADRVAERKGRRLAVMFGGTGMFALAIGAAIAPPLPRVVLIAIFAYLSARVGSTINEFLRSKT